MTLQPSQILGSSDFFKQIYNEAHDPILLVDVETMSLIDSNQAFLNLLGIPDKATLQKLTLLTLSPPKQPNGITSATLLRIWPSRQKQEDICALSVFTNARMA